MKRQHKSNRAVLVLECPWELDNDDSNRSSVLPFVEGIAKYAGDTEVYHANFYDKSSFKKALAYLCKCRFESTVVYIAAHGYKKKIAGIDIFDLLLEIGKYSKSSNITGIMLGSCFVGKETTSIQVCIEGTNIKWCAGYASSCEWLTGTMIDCSIMAALLELDDEDFGDRDNVIGELASALSPFSKTFVIGDDYKGASVTLEDSIQFVVQVTGQGNRARTVTEDVLDAYEFFQEYESA